MASRTFRIRVRGMFDRLTPDQRHDLLEHAAEHDPFSAAFTPEGHMSYDLASRPFFSFRVEDSGDSDMDLLAATDRAEAAAVAWLEDRGLAFKRLQSTAEDSSTAPLSKRQRREQRGT